MPSLVVKGENRDKTGPVLIACPTLAVGWMKSWVWNLECNLLSFLIVPSFPLKQLWRQRRWSCLLQQRVTPSHTLLENPSLHLHAGTFIILCLCFCRAAKRGEETQEEHWIPQLIQKREEESWTSASCRCYQMLPESQVLLVTSFIAQTSLFLIGRSAKRPGFTVSCQTSGHRRKRRGHFLFLHPRRRAEEEARSPAAHGRVAERPHQPRHLSAQSAAGWWAHFQLRWRRRPRH